MRIPSDGRERIQILPKHRKKRELRQSILEKTQISSTKNTNFNKEL